MLPFQILCLVSGSRFSIVHVIFFTKRDFLCAQFSMVHNGQELGGHGSAWMKNSISFPRFFFSRISHPFFFFTKRDFLCAQFSMVHNGQELGGHGSAWMKNSISSPRFSFTRISTAVI